MGENVLYNIRIEERKQQPTFFLKQNPSLGFWVYMGL